MTTDSPPVPAPSRFRIFPELERMPRVVRFVQAPSGKVLLVVAFCLIHALIGSPIWDRLLVILLLVSFLPAHRRPLVVAATVFFHLTYEKVGIGSTADVMRTIGVNAGIREPEWMSGLPIYLIAVLLFGWIYIAVTARGWFRRPFAVWTLLYLGLLTVASYAPLGSTATLVLWAFLVVVGKFFWFIGYSILDVIQTRSGSLVRQLGFWRPFWGSTHVPFGKGATYLCKVEARDAEELAVTQLKGLKLMLWAVVLAGLHQVMNLLMHGDPERLPAWMPGTLGLPHFKLTFAAHLTGSPYPRDLCWISVISVFVCDTLHLAAISHLAIATCRMAGYRALRNMYRPLEAVSFADFYNRYYFYFKELLVHFFFFPAYLHHFKKWPRMRIAFATFAAAGIGNIFYHFARDIHLIHRYGIGQALVRYQITIVYCFILATLLAISQVRDVAREKEKKRPRTALITTLMILLFYSISATIPHLGPEVTLLDFGSYYFRIFMPVGR